MLLHFRRWAAVCCLPAALVIALPLAGCAKKEPVTAANSGLKAASNDNDDKESNDKPKTDEETSKPSGDKTPANGGEKPTKKPSTMPPADALLKVPEGEPQELVAYLGKLEQRVQQLVNQLRGAGGQVSQETGELIFGDLKKVMDAQITASERILASDKATAEQRVKAIESKLDALSFMEQSGQPGAGDKSGEYIATLHNDESPEVRRLALGSLISRVSSGQESDTKVLLEQLQKFLSDGGMKLTESEFATARTAAIALLQNGEIDGGVAVMRMMAKAFAGSENADLAEAAVGMEEQATAIELEHASRQLQAGDDTVLDTLKARATAAVTPEAVAPQAVETLMRIAASLKEEKPELAKEFSDLAKTGLANLIAKPGQSADTLVIAARLAEMMDPPDTEAIAKANELVVARVQEDMSAEKIDGEAVLELLQNVANQAEYSGDLELAMKLYEVIGPAAAKIEDPKIAEKVSAEIAAAQTRVALVGKPFPIEGKLLDGSAFDWKPYEGKVVLVDFWATWCQPCLEELPNILDNYELFHKQGFEVIGVNLDQEKATVGAFLKRAQLPWTTVFTSDETARAFDSPLAKKAGVTGIPFVMLIGKDGNVMAIHVRGEKLGEELTKIFGSPPSDGVPESNIVPDEPADATPPADDSVPEEKTPPTEDAVPEGDAPAEAPVDEAVPQ